MDERNHIDEPELCVLEIDMEAMDDIVALTPEARSKIGRQIREMRETLNLRAAEEDLRYQQGSRVPLSPCVTQSNSTTHTGRAAAAE
jgi:hypothetical protein